MNTTAGRFGLTPAAVILIAILCVGCAGTTSGEPSPNVTPTPESTATMVPTLSGDNLAAGRYQADPALPVDVTVELPAGWSGNTWVAIGPNDNQAPDGMAIRFYAGDLNLFLHPLSPSDGQMDPPVGSSVEELVDAIVSHPDWNVTEEPTAITMDGYAGQLVQVTLPDGTSDATPFYLFGDPGPAISGIFGWAPGQVHDIHILDVDGQRLIVEAFHYPGTSETDLAAQQAVLDSIQIDPKP